MSEQGLVPVIEGVWRWSEWNEPRKLFFNGHALRVGGALVVVDPVPVSDEVFTALAALGPVACVVVTNRDHERAAAALRDRTRCRLLVPALDAAQINTANDGTFSDGDSIEGELRAVTVRDGKTPGETALHWPARGILLLGDAALGKPAGALTMLPDEKLPDVAKARAGVASLAALGADVVLVGDGADILAGGSAALAALNAGAAKAPAAGLGGC